MGRAILPAPYLNTGILCMVKSRKALVFDHVQDIK